MTIVLQQLINGIMLGSTYSLVAIGYTLIFGVLGLLHFAHGEVLMMGAFMGLFVALWAELPIYITIIATMGLTALLGIVVDLMAVRPIRKEFHLAPLLSTIGVTIILQNVAIKLFGGYGTRFPDLIESVNFQIGPLLLNSVNVFIFCVSIFLMIVLYFFIKKTRVGKAIRAVAESHQTASLLGVNVDTTVVITFAIASGLAGAAGVMIGLAFHTLTPYMGLNFALKGLVVMLLGGLGNVVGAMVGGLILGVVETMSVGFLTGSYQDMFAFGVMILILLFKPTGLFGTRLAQA